jgi:hypothetical protein
MKYTLPRIVLAFFGVYHLLIGGVMLFSGDLMLRLARDYGMANLAGSPELGALSEILACYLLAFGAVMAYAAYDPIKNRTIISIGVLLCLLRLFQRAYFAEKTMRVLQVAPAQYWMQFVIVAVIAVVLAVFRWMVLRDMSRKGAVA